MNLLAARTAPRSGGMHASTFSIAIAGGLLMWATQPPLAIGWIAWVAPVPWLMLVRAEELPGRRPYRALWLAGLIYWLTAIQWLRLAHPAVYVGWFVLSAYLGAYLPAFVAISRMAVHRLRVPLWLAAPVAWTGLELARAHLFTGFLMGSLADTQVHWITIIQMSDVVGEYGVDFLIIAVAAALTSVIVPPRRPFTIVPAVVCVAAAFAYGNWRLHAGGEAPTATDNPKSVRIALIQGNSVPDWSFDPAKQRENMDEYVRLSRQAIEKAKRTGDGRPVDLVVWPETTFRTGLREVDSKLAWPKDAPQSVAEYVAAGPRDLASLVDLLKTPVLVGTDRIRLIADSTAPVDEPRFLAYNSSALVGRDGKIIGTYDKSHLVMFGEYIPFANWFPNLYHLSPITAGTEEGEGPKSLCTGGICYAPDICYESAIPHVIREQMATLAARGQTPDILVNITNDSWYWGASELDMHLACGVFRAVETRRPMVIAANGGISAWIDASGRIRAQSPRQKDDVIIADVDPGRIESPYVKYGDWFAGLCLLCTAAVVLINWILKWVRPDAELIPTNNDV